MIKTRTFHAVGQGAFYSEKHADFHIVYDCGTSNNKKILLEKINNAFSQDDKIILFISHFDKDHISGISALRNRTNITHVIMPLLYDEDKVLRIAYLRANRLNEKILANPKEYYGKTTKIIYVEPNSSEKDNEDPFYLDSLSEYNNDISLQKTIIKSGRIIKRNKYTDWIFVPYNYDSKSRHRQIVNLLKILNINVTQFIKDSKYALSQIKNHLKEIKQIYNDTKGNGIRGKTSLINENSMFLYSGPMGYSDYTTLPLIRNSILLHLNIKQGCIYTGDGNLKLRNLDLNKVYLKYIQNVGTVQIPHHGSKNSFKESFFIGNNYVCPISAGQNYENFPASTVIKALIKACCFPYIITEKTCSFVERFDR